VIIGFREWRLGRTDRSAPFGLYPLTDNNRSRPWSPGVTVAACDVRRSASFRAHLVDLGLLDPDDNPNPYELARLAREHRAQFRPVVECRCGLYTWADPASVRKVWIGDTGRAVVRGMVLLTGRVIHHGGEGWRGERARIVALVTWQPVKLKALLPDFEGIEVVRSMDALEPIRVRWSDD
jgi:hypothetical protein